jgi:hypothetical protein
MTEYDIKRWDAVLFGNSEAQVPMIYIKPDIDFLSFARVNNYAVMATINGTGTQYDGHKIPGVVSTSCAIPGNRRPNYFKKTGYYVVTLQSNWYGYPDPKHLGTVSFEGLRLASPEDGRGASPGTVEPFVPLKNGMENSQLSVAVAGIFIIGLFAWLMSK